MSEAAKNLPETTTKAQVLGMIERMPDDATLDDILYAVYVRQKIEAGLRDIEAGRTISHEEMMHQMDEWLASAGH